MSGQRDATRLIREIVGRRAPTGVVVPRLVGSPTVAGATALAGLAAALCVGLSVVGIGPMFGPPLAMEAFRHVPFEQFVALILPGLTDPSSFMAA